MPVPGQQGDVGQVGRGNEPENRGRGPLKIRIDLRDLEAAAKAQQEAAAGLMQIRILVEQERQAQLYLQP